jgi:sugar phosphate isomerase/epimerase
VAVRLGLEGTAIAERPRGTAPRVGACTWIYGDLPLRDVLRRIADAGCDGVEIAGEPDRWPAAEVRRLLAETRLAPLALTASCRVPQTNRDLASPDPAVRAEALEYLRACLVWAAEIGAPLVQMLPSGETRLTPIASRDEEWRWSVEGVRAAALDAERHGVRIAIEPLNRYEAYLVTTVDDAVAYVADVGSPSVGMTVDVFHAGIEDRSPADAVRAAGARLFHLHVAESNRRGLGRGHLDLSALAAALGAVDYRGSIVLEVVPPGASPYAVLRPALVAEMVDDYVRESVRALRKTLTLPG